MTGLRRGRLDRCESPVEDRRQHLVRQRLAPQALGHFIRCYAPEAIDSRVGQIPPANQVAHVPHWQLQDVSRLMGQQRCPTPLCRARALGPVGCSLRRHLSTIARAP